jgi:hypothetical protein
MRTVLAVLVAAGLAASYDPIIAAEQQSGATPAKSPAVSKSIARQLKAAQDAIGMQQYDTAFAQVQAAQSVAVARSDYDNYIIDSFLVKIYAERKDINHLIPVVESLAQSPYATPEQLKALYLYLASQHYHDRDYARAVSAARQAARHGASEGETARLIASAQRAQGYDEHLQRLRRISELQPGRRDMPLRYLNISDNEVREIQGVVATHPPYDFVSIGPVVTGCPAEEGAACTDQVWVDLHRPGETGGLLLSRINNRWDIGLVQQWYFCKAALEARRDKFSSYREYAAAADALIGSFPLCAAPHSVTESP